MNDRSGRKGDGFRQRRASGLLGALARNTAGNTLAMMAAFLMPLALLVGSAVDMSRLYLVKVRLQQACDAGVLAGRKLMTVTSGTTIDDAVANPTKPAETAATQFFQNNFPSGWMSTTGRTFSVSRTSDGQVAGTASVTVPMAIMGAFGAGAQAQTVTCNARLDIGDTDVMFVLDVTGSMACATGTACTSTATWTRGDGTTGWYQTEQSGSKIDALRSAVKLFRTTLETGKPAAAHIRYGFVPYSSTVNVGALIYAKDPTYLVNSATYPSRELAADINSSTLPTGNNSSNYEVTTSSAPGKYYEGDMIYGANSNPTGATVTLTSPNINKAGCLAKEVRTTNGTDNFAKGTFPTNGAALTRKFPVWSSNTCKLYSWTVKPYWRYTNVSLDVSTYKTFANVTDPTKITAGTVKWQGCIEERDTTVSTTTTTYNIASLPGDLNPDLVPTNDATRWRPLWPNVVYYRPGTGASLYANGSGSSASSSDNTTNIDAGDDYSPLLTSNFTSSSSTGSLARNYQWYACSAPARTLAEMTAAEFDTYLGPDHATNMSGDFRAMGRTYHDVGMLWGLRLISPQGPWASTTAAWPGNNPPNRYIVFMTDGLMQPSPDAYGLYSIGDFMGRSAAAGTSEANLNTIHNARFQAVCDAAQAKNITVFVVAFDVGSTVPSNLADCATPGYAYAATSKTALENAFKTIALQIARLRLSQ